MNSSTNATGVSVTMTSDEMVERSSSWTLSCDNSLLSRLKLLSEHLDNNSQEISRSCESLGNDVSLLQARLANATNQFLMLSNNQFVENRVQEFQEVDEVLASSNSSTAAVKTKAEKEVEVISKMKEAISLGLAAQEKYSSRNIKPSYTIQFPHLIGSAKFFSSRYVGLLDENLRLPSLRESLSPSPPSINMVTAEEFNPICYANSSTNQIGPNDKEYINRNIPRHADIEDEIFGDSICDPQKRQQVKPVENSFYDSSPPPQAVLESSVINPSVTSLNKDLYFNHPSTNAFGPPHIASPPLDDDTSDDSENDFRASDSGRRLFIDDDEDDLFSDTSLFNRNNRHTVLGNNQTPSIPNNSMQPPESNANSEENKSRYNRDFIERDAIFSTKSQNDEQSNLIKVQEESNNAEVTEATIKIPTGAVSVFGNVPPTGLPKLRSQQNTQILTDARKEEGNVPTISRPPTQNQSALASGRSVSGLSDSKDANVAKTNIFSKGVVKPQASVNKEGSNKLRTGVGIFQDSSDDEEDLFAAIKKNNVKVAERHTNQSRTKLFEETLSNETTPNHSASLVKVNGIVEKTSLPKKSIFDDSESDSEDNIFLPSKSVLNYSNPVPDSNFKKNTGISNTVTGKNMTTDVTFDTLRDDELGGEVVIKDVTSTIRNSDIDRDCVSSESKLNKIQDKYEDINHQPKSLISVSSVGDKQNVDEDNAKPKVDASNQSTDLLSQPTNQPVQKNDQGPTLITPDFVVGDTNLQEEVKIKEEHSEDTVSGTVKSIATTNIFSNAALKPQVPVNNEASNKLSTGVGIFQDSSDDEEDLFATIKKDTVKVSEKHKNQSSAKLFEEALFSETTPNKSASLFKVNGHNKDTDGKNSFAKKSIFEDSESDSEDNIFLPSKSVLNYSNPALDSNFKKHTGINNSMMDGQSTGELGGELVIKDETSTVQSSDIGRESKLSEIPNEYEEINHQPKSLISVSSVEDKQSVDDGNAKPEIDTSNLSTDLTKEQAPSPTPITPDLFASDTNVGEEVNKKDEQRKGKVSGTVKSVRNIKSKLLEAKNSTSIPTKSNKMSSNIVRSKPSVKTLALCLNINPLSIRPGAKPPKLKSDDSKPSSTDTSSEQCTPDTPQELLIEKDSPGSPMTELTPEAIRESDPVSADDPCQLLPSLSKGRVKIPIKRRLPSKQHLKSYLSASTEPNINHSTDSDEVVNELPI